MRFGVGMAVCLAKRATATFTPTSLSGLTMWLDAAAVTAGGGVVTAFTNKGSGTAPTVPAGAEPTYTASTAAYKDGPTFKFAAGTGAAKYIQAAAASHGLTTGPYTVVIVGSVGNANYAMGAPSGGTLIAGGGGSGDKWQMTSDAGSYLVSTGLADTPSVLIATFNGASSGIYASSTTGVTGTAGTIEDLSASALYIGNYGAPGDALGADRDWRHFLLINRALTADERASLITWGAGYIT